MVKPVLFASLLGSVAWICVPVLLPSAILARGSSSFEANSVSGIVLDTRGQPLAGALVRVNRDFTYGRSQTTTASNGRYRIRDLVNGTYRANAFMQVKWNGTTVCQRLAMPNPDDYNSFAVDKGAERNFRWQLTGKIGYTDTFFGATIKLANSYLHHKTARAIEFTLTPTLPLLDGSPGKVIVRQVPLEPPANDDALTDIPLGVYRLEAVKIGRDGSRAPVQITTNPTGPTQSSLETKWRSTTRCGFGPDSGVEPLGLWLENPR